MRRPILIVALGAAVLGPAPLLAEPVRLGAPAAPRVTETGRRKPAVRPSARPRLVTVVRYAGNDAWSLADAGVVAEFFESRFGRPLPISAWGQTALHDRLRLDHSNALDVAVHPDSPEGRALLAFLRSQGIPFVAVRARMRGVSTGAHIHVGPESGRLAPASRPTHVAKVRRERLVLVSGRARSVADTPTRPPVLDGRAPAGPHGEEQGTSAAADPPIL